MGGRLSLLLQKDLPMAGVIDTSEFRKGMKIEIAHLKKHLEHFQELWIIWRYNLSISGFDLTLLNRPLPGIDRNREDV